MPTPTRPLSLCVTLLACACQLPAETEDLPASTACDSACDSGETDTAEPTTGAPDPDDTDTTDTDTTDTDTTDTGETDTAEPPVCAALPGAPEPIEIANVLAVPIDIVDVHAELRFDLLRHRATGSAVVEFRAGAVEGVPLFDLRQTITRAVLDGEVLPADALATLQTPADDVPIRVLERLLAPCSQHRLELEYLVEAQPGESDPAFFWVGDTVAWGTHLADYPAGWLAEQWLPSNLIHDTHALTIAVVLDETDAPHDLVANGAVDPRTPGRWTVTWPEATSMTPLIQLCPAHRVTRLDLVVDAGAPVDTIVWRCDAWTAATGALDEFAETVAEGLQYAAGELGPYPHGERFLAIVNTLSIYPMEYPGGTVSDSWALGHEVFHSWAGRSVRPLTQRDAWFDEAWTDYARDDAYTSAPISLLEDPSRLVGETAWARSFSVAAYTRGPRVFAAIAEQIGTDEMRALLHDLHAAHAGQAISTEALERFLECRVDGGLVRALFHRFVYGEDGEAPARPAGYCDGEDA